MKKLLALLLSVMMAASLAVPAFADGPDGPAPVDGDAGYFVNGEAAPVYRPGEALPISAVLDESIGVIGGADGPTSIITSGILNGISLEDFMNLPEDAAVEDLVKQLEQQAQSQRDELKKSLGGVPGQVGVMVNGEYVKFPDAAPEVTDGRTMVPVRALVETLGGKVEYQAGTDGDVIRFVIDGYAYEFATGSTTVKVSVTADNGKDTPKPEDIKMDCAPYIKGGRTYVPIRFISEALGYEVGWDNDFQTAILLDRAALAEEFDKDYTIMNKVQANRVAGWEKDKTLSTDMKGNVTATAFDTLNGSKTYKADFDSQVLMDREAVSGGFSIKLSDNVVDLLVGQYGDMDEEVLERLELMVKALEDAEFIMNQEGRMWVKSPALDELGGKKDIWCGVDMSAEETQAIFVDADNATVGTALAAMMPTDSVMMWSQMGVVAAAMELYRDENFTTSGGVSTLTIGLEELGKVYEALTGESTFAEDALGVFKEYEITIQVDGKGGAAVTLDMETAPQAGMPGVKMTMEAIQAGGKADLTMDVHAANIGELKLTMNTNQKTVSGKPMSEPPEGANVVDAPELLEP